MTGDEIPYAYLLWSYPYLQRTRIRGLPLPTLRRAVNPVNPRTCVGIRARCPVNWVWKCSDSRQSILQPDAL